MTDLVNRESIKEFIKTEALSLGFSHFGVTAPTPHPNLVHYENWIAENRQAGMAYMARPDRLEKIKDPKKILPNCKSILVFALPYHPAKNFEEPLKNSIGQIASYAIGPDYHNIIPGLLEQIMNAAQKAFPSITFEYKIYTDTGPILEKAYAQSAGLGWISKNSCLIIPKFGSYIFLAEILLNLELPFDEPFSQDLCGTCQACVQACPTQAILNNRTIDANRCLSYHSIENKADIPADIQEKLGHWVFGCDICQMICPWNKKYAKEPAHQYFSPFAAFPALDLAKLDILSPEEFNKNFMISPIKRSKRRGYYRNICIVLGNTRSEKHIPFLEKLMQEETDTSILRHAIQAMKKINPTNASHIEKKYSDKLETI